MRAFLIFETTPKGTKAHAIETPSPAFGRALWEHLASLLNIKVENITHVGKYSCMENAKKVADAINSH